MTELQVWLMFGVNILVLVTGISKGISVLLSVRDEIRDIKSHVGTTEPKSGLLGDVTTIKQEVRKHSDQMIAIRIRLGMRREDDHPEWEN